MTQLTNKIRAAVYRELADSMDSFDTLDAEGLRERAGEKDPPRPEPDTWVWWRYLGEEQWFPGVVKIDGVEDHDNYPDWDEIEWKPARILAPDEVAVKVPPVSEWPIWAEAIMSQPYYVGDGRTTD